MVEINLNASNKKESPFNRPLILLEDLINKSLAIALDTIICNRYDKVKKLMTLRGIAETTGRPLSSVRVACSQKKYICSKIDGKVKTHPDLFFLPK